jgi:hypothetical protein
MEAYALKDLLMKNIKKAHNTLRYSKEPKNASGSNMGNVVKALLQCGGSGSRESSLETGGSERDIKASTQGGWVEKHRRLLRRRSSEQEEVALVAMKKMSGEGKPTTTSKEQILALYGVKVGEQEVPVPAPVICKSKVEDTPILDVIDLTDEQSPVQETKPDPKEFKSYFDTHRGKVVRAWEDGTLEEAKTEMGVGGFVVGHFGDGTTYTSQVPNVCFQLKNTDRFFCDAKKKDENKKQTNKKVEQAKPTKKQEAQGSPKKKCTPTTKKKDKQLQLQHAEHDVSQKEGPEQGGLPEQAGKEPAGIAICNCSLAFQTS